MICILEFPSTDGILPVFLCDTESGYTGKDVMTKPGVYEKVVSDSLSLPIVQISGKINNTNLSIMPLIANKSAGGADAREISNFTPRLQPLLTQPVTAINMILKRYPENERGLLQSMIDTFHFYETVTPDTHVELPPDAFAFLDDEVAKQMQSNVGSYALKSSQNSEIVQKNATSEYGLVLPTLDDLHSGGDKVNALDVLRVTAPYRQVLGQGGGINYHGIYHTPYYRVNNPNAGRVPSFLGNLSGNVRNNDLEIQQNEKHMYDNLFMFINADRARYLNQLCTGIFFQTILGQKLSQIINCQDPTLFEKLFENLVTVELPGCTCKLTLSAVQEKIANGIVSRELAELVRTNLEVSVDALPEMISSQAKINRVINVDYIPFTLDIPESSRPILMDSIQNNGVITSAMNEYLLQLCSCAYTVNWGHTGVTLAIPGFVDKRTIASCTNEAVSAYLSAALQGKTLEEKYRPFLYLDAFRKDMDDYGDGDSDFIVGDSDDSAEEISASFNHYISDSTLNAMLTDNFNSMEMFSGLNTQTASNEQKIVERWRDVNGDLNLRIFISSAFKQSGSLEVFLESFYKLMRWGEVKPSLLVLNSEPEFKYVFDLNAGIQIPNAAIVDESKLVLVDGCQYTLVRVLVSRDILMGNAIVGFLLCKDYSTVKKYFIASLLDIGEMFAANEIDVAEFKKIVTLPLNDETVVDITSMMNEDCKFYVSSRNLELGLSINVQPEQLNSLFLLLKPGILKSQEYARASQAAMVVTTRDRQYQILKAYANAIRGCREYEEGLLSKISVTTNELSSLCIEVLDAYNGSSSAQAPDVNDVRAKKAIQGITLDVEGDSKIDFDTSSLSGMFTVISDMDKVSGIPPIEFSSAYVKKISESIGNCIVMLMLEKDDCCLLCRKDIVRSELLVNDKKLSHRKYTSIAPAIESLKNGIPRNIVDRATNAKKPIYLHISLKGFI